VREALLAPTAAPALPDAARSFFMLECLPRVERRIDENALRFPSELLFQRLESKQIVATDKQVFKNIADFILTRRRESAKV
jgi:hypothetical protein